MSQTSAEARDESSREGSAVLKNDDIKAQAAQQPPAPSYPGGLTLAINLFALFISLFCVALDSTIIATAIPRITDQFHALQDVGWYGSSYLLTKCAFQLPFGKTFRFFSLKWTFLAALLIFEIGSVLCAAATSSAMLIVGRTIAGIGCAGISSGGLIIIANITPMEKRATYQSLYGGIFGIASVVGPLVGGAFTDKVSWRWCFYINLPLGAVSAAFIIAFLRLPSKPNPFKDQGVLSLLWNLDPVGFILFVPSIICLLFTLQWGGTTYAWNSGPIIALFVVFGVTLLAFIASQAWLGEGGTVPPRIAKQRTIFASSLFTFCLAGTFFLLSYFIPIYFQAVKGDSALKSGIDTIPVILPNVIGILFAGFGTSKIGYYVPFIYLAVILAPIGAGLLTTLDPNTSTGKWIGYQILFGFGSGCGFQLPQVAAQVVLPPRDIPTGISVSMLFQSLGGTILISAANNVLNADLVRNINALNISGVTGMDVVNAGATGYRSIIPADRLTEVVDAYNSALKKSFQIALIMACLSALPAVLLEWKSVKKGPAGAGAPKPDAKSPSAPARDVEKGSS
ncbi:major facilitator superfamily domain-containing protein [Talaromyces proteolyticus]|uniref:Major facilitator superfamily domain-containing protein n=1 Tax=Talaromyces proteolyticus TaxID=1131652 RepID=A0AAD4KV31_9EURO|nr:major facilitator superfamily domain-containing protein [Talaromyces proteolyticus]KAH8698979.1 major facilitator superfamily domain-containing protein [Talaromyces proteolyticus]